MSSILIPEIGNVVMITEDQEPRPNYRVNRVYSNPNDENLPDVQIHEGTPLKGVTVYNPLCDIEPIGTHKLPKSNPFQASELEIVPN